jgi:hypothetical protein
MMRGLFVPGPNFLYPVNEAAYFGSQRSSRSAFHDPRRACVCCLRIDLHDSHEKVKCARHTGNNLGPRCLAGLSAWCVVAAGAECGVDSFCGRDSMADTFGTGLAYPQNTFWATPNQLKSLSFLFTGSPDRRFSGDIAQR